MKNIIITLLFLSSLKSLANVPLEEFFTPTEFKRMVLSPDGKRIAAVQEGDGRDKITILDIEKMETLSSFEFGENRRVGSLSWVSNDFVTMNVAKTVGNLDRKGRFDGVYLAKYNGGTREFIFRGESGHSVGLGQLRDSLEKEPKHILISSFPGNGIKKYNIKSKRSKSFTLPKAQMGFTAAGYFLDKNQNARGFTEFNVNGDVNFHYLPSGQIEWKKLEIPAMGYDVRITPAGFTSDPDVVYVFSNHEKPVSGLYKLNLNTGQLKFVYRHEFVDLTGTISDLDDNLVGVTIMPDYPQTIWLKDKNPFVMTMMALQASFPNQQVTLSSRTLDGNKMIMRVRSDMNPGDFYMYDTENAKLQYLASVKSKLKPEMLSPMKPITLKARDGLELHGYLTLPKGKEPKNLPLIVNPHGGPHGPRDNWQFNPEVQLLASRGYAVLQINFRGSGGYGQKFLETGYLKWGREMQDDVTDATLWAVEQGYADKERLCIYGGSYGGYAALQGVVREPDLYKCAVGYVGVYDLEQFKTCGDGAGQKARTKVLADYVGADNEIHRKYSPAYNADKIKADLFIAHGSDDVRVPMCQGNALKKGLEKAGKEFIWMVKDEGHGYQKLENQKDFYGTMLTFFEKNIGK